MTSIRVYRMAVCLYPEVTALDYQGPIELLCRFSTKNRKRHASRFSKLDPDIIPNCAIDPTYLSHSLEPIDVTSGPNVLPEQTYDNAQEQFDLILVPGGPGGANVDKSLTEFLKRQGPGAQYILTVCTGSWILANTGLLDGQRATTNKAAFRMITEQTKDRPVTWVAQARWVVSDDKRIWTSSGVTAGMDLAAAFLEHLTGTKSAMGIRGIMELSVRNEADDEWAAYHGLV